MTKDIHLPTGAGSGTCADGTSRHGKGMQQGEKGGKSLGRCGAERCAGEDPVEGLWGLQPPGRPYMQPSGGVA